MTSGHKNQQDLHAEETWHEQKFYIDSNHWTSHPIFASRERHWLQNDVEKIRFYGLLYRYIKKRPYCGIAKILVAPVGDGGDLKYLQGIYKEVHGIDISTIALEKCPGIIKKNRGDILNSDYKDESFDVVICPLFLHHVHDVGFEPFIKEFHRLLKKGGTLAILEPSSLYPISWLMSFASIILGNVTGKVEGERPINPIILSKVLAGNDFSNTIVQGLTYNHVRFPCFIQHIINLLDYPLRMVWPLKNFAFSVGWFCEKK